MELTIHYSGLIALDLESDDESSSALLLGSEDAPHAPRLVMRYKDIENKNGIEQLPFIPPSGDRYVSINLSNKIVKLARSISKNPASRRDTGRRKKPSRGSNRYYDDEMPTSSSDKDLSWAPEMRHIVGDAGAKLKPIVKTDTPGDEDTPVIARIDAMHGRFESDERSANWDRRVWVIPNTPQKKYEQFITDQVIFKQESGINDPIQLNITPFGGGESQIIELRRKDIEIAVTCLPLGVPRCRTEIEHFHHYFQILENKPHPHPPVPKVRGSEECKEFQAEGVFPVKCPPVTFP